MQEIQDICASLGQSYQKSESWLDRMVFEFNAVVSSGITRSNLVLAFANQNLNLLQKHYDCVATHMEYFKVSAQLLAAKKIVPVAPIVADLSETEHNTTAPQEEMEEVHNTLTPEEMKNLKVLLAQLRITQEMEPNTTAPQEETEEVQNTPTPEEPEHNNTAPQEETEEVHNTLTPEEMKNLEVLLAQLRITQEMEPNTTAPQEETEEVQNTPTPEETEHNNTAQQEETEEVHNTLTPEEMKNLEVFLAQLHITQETDNPEVLNLKELLTQLNHAYKNYEEGTGPAVRWGEDKAALYRNSDSKIYSSTTINTSGPVETMANLYAGLLFAYQNCQRVLASLVAKYNSDVTGGIMKTTTALGIAICNTKFVQHYFLLLNTVGRHFMLIAVLMTLMDPTGSEPEVTEEEFKTLMRLQILLE